MKLQQNFAFSGDTYHIRSLLRFSNSSLSISPFAYLSFNISRADLLWFSGLFWPKDLETSQIMATRIRIPIIQYHAIPSPIPIPPNPRMIILLSFFIYTYDCVYLLYFPWLFIFIFECMLSVPLSFIFCSPIIIIWGCSLMTAVI